MAICTEAWSITMLRSRCARATFFPISSRSLTTRAACSRARRSSFSMRRESWKEWTLRSTSAAKHAHIHQGTPPREPVGALKITVLASFGFFSYGDLKHLNEDSLRHSPQPRALGRRTPRSTAREDSFRKTRAPGRPPGVPRAERVVQHGPDCTVAVRAGRDGHLRTPAASGSREFRSSPYARAPRVSWRRARRHPDQSPPPQSSSTARGYRASAPERERSSRPSPGYACPPTVAREIQRR